jgi:hypothetical protein
VSRWSWPTASSTPRRMRMAPDPRPTSRRRRSARVSESAGEGEPREEDTCLPEASSRSAISLPRIAEGTGDDVQLTRARVFGRDCDLVASPVFVWRVTIKGRWAASSSTLFRSIPRRSERFSRRGWNSNPTTGLPQRDSQRARGLGDTSSPGVGVRDPAGETESGFTLLEAGLLTLSAWRSRLHPVSAQASTQTVPSPGRKP